MSTYDIGIYEDMTKNFFQLSLNIKYAPYFFCCSPKAYAVHTGDRLLQLVPFSNVQT